MWFKNLRAFRLTAPFDLTAEQLQEQLLTAAFVPCGKSQPLSLGWVPPLGEETEALVHAAGGRFLLCMRREEKLLPAAVVREQLAERIAVIEHEQDRKVYRKEKLQLKDEVIQDCLPRAFTRSTLIFAYLDTTTNWLFVDSAGAGRAEELVSLLRDSIGTLPLLLPEVNQSPAHAMTGWLLNDNLPSGFSLGADCDLREPGEEGGVVRCRGIELAGEEIEAHLVAVVLGEDLVLRRLRFAEEFLAENDDIAEADPLARLDADFALMTDVVSSLQSRVMEVFGGEVAR
jgi:recombination associated protein RdgC